MSDAQTRRRETARRYTELAESACVHVAMLRRGDGRDPELAKLAALVAAAETKARTGDLVEATRMIRGLLPSLAFRLREKRLECPPPDATIRARVARTLAAAAFAEAYRQPAETRQTSFFSDAGTAFARGEARLAAGDAADASGEFTRAISLLDETIKDDPLTARLQELRARRGALVRELRDLPSRRFTPKQRECALAAIRVFDAAIHKRDEACAAAALEECRTFLDAPPPPEPTKAGARNEDDYDIPPERASSAGLLTLAAVGLLALGVGLGVLDLEGILAGGTAEIAHTEIAPAPRADVLAFASRAGSTRGESAKPPPAVPAAESRRAAPNVGMSSAAIRAAAPSAPRAVEPPAVETARVADSAADPVDVFPEAATLVVPVDSEPVFQVHEAGPDASIVWEVNGRRTGTGTEFRLGRDVTGHVGDRWLAAVADAGGKRRLLSSWQVTVVDRMSFTALEPAKPAVEARAGETVRFHAPAAPGRVTYRWSVDGRVIEGAGGPELELRITSRRRHFVLVRAESSPKAGIEAWWIVTVSGARGAETALSAR